MSGWADKFEKKLSVLTDTSSKESIQTLAKWLGFNRKNAPAITSVLCKAIEGASSDARKLLYWQVIHEVLVLDNGTPRWEKGADLRVAVGENAVIPILSKPQPASVREKVSSYLQEWDEMNVFGGPSLVGQIKRLISAREAQTSEKTEEDKPEKNESTSIEQDARKPAAAAEPAAETGKSESPSKRRSSISSVTDVEYDFESKGIPFRAVESREFLEPCKAIATLQIARDLRNDATVQLASLIAAIPEDIMEKCRDMQGGESLELSDEQALDYSKRMGEKLLDMDLDEQLENAQTYADIVRKQREARSKMIQLLIESRCQFGSMDSAKAFYDLADKETKIKHRKRLITDAMELEGLDFETKETKTVEQSDEDLAPLDWYEESSGNKKARIENDE